MTCARPASMFAAAAVATLFQVGPIGAQSMTETRISTAIIPVEHVVVRTKKPYIEVKAALETRLGRLDSDILRLLRENKVDELRAALEKLAGRDGLAIHYVAARRLADSQRWSSKWHRLLYRKRPVGSCDDPSELRCRSVCAATRCGI